MNDTVLGSTTLLWKLISLEDVAIWLTGHHDKVSYRAFRAIEQGSGLGGDKIVSWVRCKAWRRKKWIGKSNCTEPTDIYAAQRTSAY